MTAPEGTKADIPEVQTPKALRAVKDREVSRKEAIPAIALAQAALKNLDGELAKAETEEQIANIKARMSEVIDGVPLTDDWRAGGQGLATDASESLC